MRVIDHVWFPFHKPWIFNPLGNDNSAYYNLMVTGDLYRLKRTLFTFPISDSNIFMSYHPEGRLFLLLGRNKGKTQEGRGSKMLYCSPVPPDIPSVRERNLNGYLLFRHGGIDPDELASASLRNIPEQLRQGVEHKLIEYVCRFFPYSFTAHERLKIVERNSSASLEANLESNELA